MTLWLVRAGKNGEGEELALEQGLAVIGWDDLPDLSGVATRDEVAGLMTTEYSDANPNTIINWARQVWTFRAVIQKGDYVVLPLKRRAAIAIGRVAGPYQYRSDLGDVHHVRSVKWLATDIPRSAVDQDLLYSLGAFLTVCRIQRNDAETRILALLEKKPSTETVALSAEEEIVTDALVAPDFVEQARDQIRGFITRKFRTTALEHLIAALLEAQGYRTQLAPGGPDGGVDIIAGRGPMGFDSPRMCVQVKSGGKPLDVKVIRELQGVMNQFKADHGLLVAWNGFTRPAQKEARQLYFQIRLWDSDDVMDALFQHYDDQLSEEIRTELPLQRLWILVPEAEQE
jgi:restriction system protein